MNILHVIDTLDPAAGGPAESVRRILASYRLMGHTGEVVTMDDPNAPFLKELQFPVHPLGPIHTVYGANLKMIPWLNANRHRFDGAIVQGLWTFSSLAVWRAFKGKLPYLVFTHGMLDPYFKRAFPMKHAKKWIYWLLAQYWILRDADRVLFTAKAEAELAKQSFWLHKWTPLVVPYGASGPLSSPEACLAAFHAHYPGVNGKKYLLYLSRIHPKKGCDLLIDAFAQVAVRAPDLHLVVAGPDQVGWREKLEARALAAGIADRVHWPGMLHDDIKWGAYYGAEAFILPSHQENFGIVVAEALACGRPALLSDKVNIASDVRDAGAAYVEHDTAEGTLNLLTRWIATPAEERKRMEDNALACFRQHYDMRENAKSTVRIFEQITRERQKK